MCGHVQISDHFGDLWIRHFTFARFAKLVRNALANPCHGHRHRECLLRCCSDRRVAVRIEERQRQSKPPRIGRDSHQVQEERFTCCGRLKLFNPRPAKSSLRFPSHAVPPLPRVVSIRAQMLRVFPSKSERFRNASESLSAGSQALLLPRRERVPS
jgi:hypothetical protein